MTYLADFCAWFQRQQAANRLEMLVTLLQMLHPLELRFVGACVEELARKDYYCLREYEIRSNSGQAVAQLADLSDATCRSRLVVALSLLYSGNYAASAVLYRILLNLNTIFHQLPKTKDVFDEIVLLLVMAKHHPAFRFDQRAHVAELLDKIAASMAQIEEECAASTMVEEKISSIDGHGELHEAKCDAVESENACSVSAKSMVDRATQAAEDQERFCCTCRGGGAPSGDSGSSCVQPKSLYVTNIAVRGTRKTENENVYDLQVTWSNDEQSEVSKTLREMYDFHRQLLDWYPRDAGACGSGRKIPYFPGYRDGSAGESASSENVSREVYDYIKDLVKLSPEILRSEYTINFFKITSPLASPSSAKYDADLSANRLPAPQRPSVLDPGSSEEADCIDAEGRVKSLTIYNSHVPSERRQSKDEARSETKTSPVARQENEAQSVLLPGSAKRVSKKSSLSHGVSNARSNSPSQKAFESTTATSQTSTDLTQSVSTASSASGSGGKKNARKTSTSSLSSFIPNPLYSILKQEGVLEEYKHHLFGRSLEELCTMTDADLTKAGLPLEPCLAVINSVKNCVLASTKHLNGTVVPKFNAMDVVGDMVLPLMSPSHYRVTPPILDLRSSSIGPDGTPVAVTPVPTVGVPYVSVGGALSVDTGVHGRTNYADVVSGPINATSCSSHLTPQLSESNPATDASVASTILDSRFLSSTQQKLLLPLNPEMAASTTTCGLSSNDPSLISAAWVQLSSEDDFTPVVRSYSVDSSEPLTAPTCVVNFNTSTSLPPSQSQSPAPGESQQQPPSFPMTTGVMSTSATFPVQHNSSQQHYHHHHHHHHQRNSKQSYRSSAPLHSFSKGGMPHPPNTLQRRSYVPAYDYSRPQQHLVSYIPSHHQPQPVAGHQMALSAAIPAATFVRAPPPSSTIPPQPCIRFVCQQCNGTSTNCSLCHGSWNNGLLTPANAAAAGGPFLFQLTRTPTGPPPPTGQLFSPAYLTTPPGNSPLATSHFFGGPPPGYRLSTAAMPTSPMVFKSASATSVSDEQQQHTQVAVDQQQMGRNLVNESMVSVPLMGSNVVTESCCNCGLQGHTRDTCVEPTLDDMTSSGHFHLHLSAKEDSTSTSQDR